MKQLIHLMRHDLLLLQRNKMIIISILVTVLYMLVFKVISRWGGVDKLLVLVIFNDPALLGFLFIGVMVLFEKNENVIQALAVSPMETHYYILSKSLSLTLVSVVACLAMALAGKGFDFNPIHFIFAAVLTTLLFSFLGALLVARLANFNTYIIRAVGAILLLTTPFIGFFGIISKYWFIFIPTMPFIELFRLVFPNLVFPNDLALIEIILMYVLSIFWCIVSYFCSVNAIKKSFVK